MPLTVLNEPPVVQYAANVLMFMFPILLRVMFLII